MRKPTRRERYLRDIQTELSKFEQKERAFCQRDRDERAAQLRLPIAPRRSLIDKRVRVYEDS
jgi:hypothetical protein